MKKLVVLSMVAGVICAANAATVRYQNSGDWFDVDLSDSIGWQGGVLPGAADTVRVNWGSWAGNTVTLNGAAPTITKFQLGVDESGTLVVGSGGSLTATSDSRVGNNNWTTGKLIINGGTVTNNSWLGVATGNGGTKPAGWDPLNPTAAWGATYGVIEINGGMLNIGSHLWCATGGVNASAPAGAPTSVATITINNGGVINVGQNIGLGSINAVDPSAGGGIATLTVNNGGLLNLHHWDDAGSIQAGSVLNINGTGMVKVGGNRVDAAYNYFDLGRIASDLGAINAVYTADGDFTTITAIPEPATMSLLAMGALALLRKRK